MHTAAAAGARLIHFTEGAISGYREALTAETDWQGLREELDKTAELAGELGLWVVAGANHPLTPPHRPHNSLYVISATGHLHGRYDKRLLSFNEVSNWYTPGVDAFVFDVDGFRFGCALCIEIQFPELFVDYATRGVDVVLLSTYSRNPMFPILALGHAACGAFWLSFSVAAQCSEAAAAGLIGPNGQWLARAPGDGSEALVLADLDRTAEELREALVYARPWRARSRSGELHIAARVDDPRSANRLTF